MKYELITDLALNKSSCLVLGLLSDGILPDFIASLERPQQDLLKRLITKLSNAGDIAWQSDFEGQSLLLIHCGETTQYAAENMLQRIDDIATLLLKQRITSTTLYLPPLPQHTADWQLQQMLLRFENNRYQLLDYKTKNNKPYVLESLQFYQPGAIDITIETAQIISKSINFTRNLANMPANICTPIYMAERARKLVKQNNKLQVNILDRETMDKMGMNAFLAVAKGSQQPPQLIEIQYHGKDKTSPPIVLVGKGITFDSGGISLKPPLGMEEMKFDMAGAASVMGVLKACAALKLPINVIGLLACAENMPSGSAVKPGDVVTSLSGQTIEIVNTDAEGRLVLADTLTYAERFNPSLVIDIATLTGAVIVALGHVTSGFMTKDDALAQLIQDAARNSEDKAWRLPLDEAYQESINSPIADIANSTGTDRAAGSVTAACFLSRFTTQYRWAHIDIAGTAWISGSKRNATGRPVPLLIQLLRQLADSSNAY